MDVVQGLDAITVHLTAANKDKARDFYTRILGLKELRWDEADGRGFWEISPGARLIAHVMAPHEPGRPPGGVTGVMLTASDVRASAAEIARRGGTLVDPPWTSPWGTHYATVADPDGNEFLLIQR